MAVFALRSATILVGCADPTPVAAARVDHVDPAEAEPAGPITPVRAPRGLRADRVALGDRLFHDPRLSGDGTVSCASCHPLDRGGMDGRARSIGIGGGVGGINAPTVYNTSLHVAWFWDGRASTLEAQVDGPLQDPREMGSSWEHVVAVLSADATMVSAFREAFDGPPSADAVRSAIADFERSLVTPDAPMDRWLRGDASALTEAQVRGWDRFQDLGCVACHQGEGVGGNLYQRFGVLGDYFADRGDLTDADLGRFAVTGREADRHVFKVPSLRNVARTGPWFHDGSADTLDRAVRVMGRYQLGRDLPDDDVADLVAFLHALDGELPSRGGAP